MKVSGSTARVLAAFALIAVGLLAQGGVAAAHGGSSPGTLFVSPTGQAGAADLSCGTAAYSKIQSAVDAAAAWSTVTVCAGSYTEDVIVSTPLTLVGRNAVINGST